ncbi:MAG: hypothetical protein R3F19_35030 [Verrucomicrobiales bacterium]
MPELLLIQATTASMRRIFYVLCICLVVFALYIFSLIFDNAAPSERLSFFENQKSPISPEGHGLRGAEFQYGPIKPKRRDYRSGNLVQANLEWLGSKARALTSEETKVWLEHEQYSAEAYLAVLMSNSPSPEGWEPTEFYREMFHRHESNAAVALYSLLTGKEDDPSRFMELAPDNPIADHVAALKLLREGKVDDALESLRNAVQKDAPTAYYEQIRPAVFKMFEFSGRSEEGADAWANFSIRESDLSSIGSEMGRIFLSIPPKNDEELLMRAAYVADVGLTLEEVPMAGPDSYSWNGFTMPAVLEILNDHSDLIPAIFNDTSENVITNLSQMSEQRAYEAPFYFNGHCDFIDQLAPDKRTSFYEEARSIGPLAAYRNLVGSTDSH